MSEIAFRAARADDLATIVGMLVDDSLGKQRESLDGELPGAYVDAFAEIDRDPNNELLLATLDDAVIGVLQLTFIPYLTYQGSWRLLIEGVRVHESHRGRGVGQAMFEEAIRRARSRRCRIVQLTSDKRRLDAQRFYERLGFVASHEGYKLHLVYD